MIIFYGSFNILRYNLVHFQNKLKNKVQMTYWTFWMNLGAGPLLIKTGAPQALVGEI